MYDYVVFIKEVLTTKVYNEVKYIGMYPLSWF